jgi:hypothetical protein
MHAQTNIADADILLLGADPLENPEVYRKHSPITYAGRVTTPTLILHGEKEIIIARRYWPPSVLPMQWLATWAGWTCKISFMAWITWSSRG